MKKLLVGSAAIALGLAVAAPAHAQLQLGVAGHFKGYVSWDDQDETTGPTTEERHLDILRDTEVHFTGETTLDNGLTVGVHIEAAADNSDSFAIDESYAYFSGMWGRVNFGDEDGANYLLQVAAPSADSNVDGIRQYINPVNYGITTLSGTFTNIDYANDATRNLDKVTYLTPVFSGFQAGVSYTPDASGSGFASRALGNSAKKDVVNIFGSAYDAAARWEGTWNNVGINVGGGYTWVDRELQTAAFDSFEEWNAGLDLNIAAFGIGAVYTENNRGLSGDNDNKTWVLGADYTTGPFKLGASYLNNDIETAAAGGDIETERYSGGVVYSFAPGMSFRGSVGFIDHDVEGAAADVDATYGLIGTQINF